MTSEPIEGYIGSHLISEKKILRYIYCLIYDLNIVNTQIFYIMNFEQKGY